MKNIHKRQYFIPWREGYNVEAIKEALRKLAPNKGTGLNDLVRVRTARQYGWSNQPEVVCFSTFFCPENVRAYIQPEIDALPWGHAFPPNIQEKDW